MKYTISCFGLLFVPRDYYSQKKRRLFAPNIDLFGLWKVVVLFRAVSRNGFYQLLNQLHIDFLLSYIVCRKIDRYLTNCQHCRLYLVVSLQFWTFITSSWWYTLGFSFYIFMINFVHTRLWTHINNLSETLLLELSVGFSFWALCFRLEIQALLQWNKITQIQ